MSNWTSIEANSSGYQTNVMRNNGGTVRNHLMVGTATVGLVRVEWIQARHGMIIPTNWSWVQAWQYMTTGSFMPLGYQVDDAQNLIVQMAIDGDYQWLLLYEHDVLPMPDALVRLAEYMKRGDVPVVSGLYFTRSIPSEPMIYRKRGTLAFEDWDVGDLVWCDGVPTGFLLIDMKIIRAMWEDSEEYMIGDQKARRVFETPNKAWFDPESGQYHTEAGTSDLAWCKRVMDGGYFAKAGYPEYQELENPFLVDTGLYCHHINNSLAGEQFPPSGVVNYWKAKREWQKRPLHPEIKPEPETLEVNVTEPVKVESALT